jgi:8-oxo-dGTP pyrophosphatase MutT (NUDIX family)
MAQIRRKIFNYDNLSEYKIVDFGRKKDFYDNSISAGGCLFYKRNKQLLLIKYDDPKWPRLDDIGGQVDLNDGSIIETIIREVIEETNGKISEITLMKLFAFNKTDTFYTKKSKYCNLLVEVDDDFFTDTSVFGQIEKCDNISRTIKWYDYDKVKNQLSFRLFNNRDVIVFLDNL